MLRRRQARLSACLSVISNPRSSAGQQPFPSPGCLPLSPRIAFLTLPIFARAVGMCHQSREQNVSSWLILTRLCVIITPAVRWMATVTVKERIRHPLARDLSPCQHFCVEDILGPGTAAFLNLMVEHAAHHQARGDIAFWWMVTRLSSRLGRLSANGQHLQVPKLQRPTLGMTHVHL